MTSFGRVVAILLDLLVAQRLGPRGALPVKIQGVITYNFRLE
jgi:hypothetical protein